MADFMKKHNIHMELIGDGMCNIMVGTKKWATVPSAEFLKEVQSMYEEWLMYYCA